MGLADGNIGVEQQLVAFNVGKERYNTHELVNMMTVAD